MKKAIYKDGLYAVQTERTKSLLSLKSNNRGRYMIKSDDVELTKSKSTKHLIIALRPKMAERICFMFNNIFQRSIYIFN